MTMKKFLAFCLCSISISLTSPLATAQIGTAHLQGQVTINSTPQPGQEIIAKNTDNGFTTRTVTQENGVYIFNGLKPGTYQIYLTDKSGNNPKPIQLAVGQSLVLDFQLEASGDNAEEVDEVVVVGSQLSIKSSGGEIGTRVSQEQINSLPQNTRNFLAFADLAPGVQFTQSTDGSTKIKSGAQSASAINVFIDGVGQKNYVLQGGITGQDSSRGNPFPQSAIDEYKIITQNYSAEYDQLSSAAIVAVTKSGGNAFHGGLFYDYSNQGMREMRPLEIKENKKVPSQQGQYGFTVGGPIIQDKMHFFFAYEAKNNADPKDIAAQGSYKKPSAKNLPNEYQQFLGGVAAKFEEDLYFGKVDYLINDEQTLELATKVRKENEFTNVSGANTRSWGTDKTNDETRLDLSHKWRAENWVNDAHLIYEKANFSPHAHTRGIGKQLTDNANQTVLKVGAGEDFQQKGQNGWGLQEDFSYLAIDDHNIKTGFKYKTVELKAIEQQPYNPQYFYNIEYNLAAQPYSVKWGAPLAGIGDGSAKATNKQFGIYVQDDWTTTDRLTLNLGLRWDYEQSDSYLNYITPKDVVSGIKTSLNILKSDVNIYDYVSNGSNRSAFKNAWQPRLGFTYDISDENNITLFGGVGRAYDRNLFDYLQTETTKATYPTYSFKFQTDDPNRPDCNAVSPECIAWDQSYLTQAGLNQLVANNKGAGREVNLVNNKLKTPYSDQFSLGVRATLGEWNSEISLSHVVSKDGFIWLLANRLEDGNFFKPGDTWGPPWNKSIDGFSNTLIGTNGVETKANSLFIKFDKPKLESTWGMGIAYTFTKADTNRKAGEVYALDYPNLDGYGFHEANDLPEHRLVVTSIINLPGGINFSTKLNLQSVENFYGTDCRAGWNQCQYRTFKPDSAGFLGYKQIDLSLSKQFASNFLSNGSQLTARFDILNLTNAINHEGYADWFGGANEPLNPDLGKPTDELAGPPLTLKLGLSWDW
jgi:outer membrane receptor protein involved in Fe transport